MDKLKLTGRDLGQAFNSRCGCACLRHVVVLIIKTDYLKVENSTKENDNFRLSPVNFPSPPPSLMDIIDRLPIYPHPLQISKANGCYLGVNNQWSVL